MPACAVGDRGLEVDVVRYHRLILRCSDSDFQRVLDFVEEAPGFEIFRVTSPYRPPAKEAIDRETIEIRYPAFREMRMPPGPSADTLAGVVNVFGDSANGTRTRGALPYKFLVARLADEMAVNYRTAKGKLDTLLCAGHLKLDFGTVLFPKHLMIDEMEDRGDAEG